MMPDVDPDIPVEVRRKLFKPFVTTKVRCTGLRLSIAKRLVELHNGAIAIECPAEEGTEVVVRLPEGQGQTALAIRN